VGHRLLDGLARFGNGVAAAEAQVKTGLAFRSSAAVSPTWLSGSVKVSGVRTAQ
jgi:hypothetical protein